VAMPRFADRHVIVTGGSSGIGLATVARLVQLGARVSVIALDDADLARLRDAPPPGRHPLYLHGADVGDRVAATAAVGACVAAHGRCEVLITSAGVARPGYFSELDDDQFERHMRVNYFGTLWPVRAVVPAMVDRGGGSLVLISSAAGLLGVFGYSAYGPSKYAVRGLAETLRTELRPRGIRVSCVYPTDVDTPQLAGEEPYKPAELRSLSGTVRPIPPEQVTDVILKAVLTGRARVYQDAGTRLLARVFATAPGMAQLWVDWKVRAGARGA
jgi:3-dehydrosphinganine reductase